jgi:hypothetical protein
MNTTENLVMSTQKLSKISYRGPSRALERCIAETLHLVGLADNVLRTNQGHL